MKQRSFNSEYAGEYLSRVAFPLGGIGAGMICMEGTGYLSHVSIRNRPDVFREALSTFAAVGSARSAADARVLEGPVPSWRRFGQAGSGNGIGSATYGLPRFSQARFHAQFPFATVRLGDAEHPIEATITAWSPFTPPDPDDSSIPTAALEYTLRNGSTEPWEGVFSYNMANPVRDPNGGEHRVETIENGLLFVQEASDEHPEALGTFAVRIPRSDVKRNAAWFRGAWFDALTTAWKDVQTGACYERDAVSKGAAAGGGSLYVPVSLAPGEETVIPVLFAWHAPCSTVNFGPSAQAASGGGSGSCCSNGSCCSTENYCPWYATRFDGAEAVVGYVTANYDRLRGDSAAFRDALFSSTLPPEVIEAVSANLSILKSPTVLRERSGKFWAFEGCRDDAGCCAGSCTHVWNYAQALAHLFPSLERSMRDIEFFESQDDTGHQAFRSALPLRKPTHDFYAAADGQLGGIIKTHREWRISGDTEWLKDRWPKVRQSIDYCISTWDPREAGWLDEPHHNTYDIEFWGPEPMCTTIYLAALEAAAAMGAALGEPVERYRDLSARSRERLAELFNGEYYEQRVRSSGLSATPPTEDERLLERVYTSEEARALCEKEGPKYQYGEGCLSDQVFGEYLALCAGLPAVLPETEAKSALSAVHRHNLKRDLSLHSNPQRSTFAFGDEGGLLLCSWPRGGKPTLPMVYAEEVWTGIEYQVAAHAIYRGLVAEGLDIVRTCRARYDGRDRNPFNEYECGHWYARALASYALLEALTGVRYDAVEKTLHVAPRIPGDFVSFLCTETGFGTVGVRDGEPFCDVARGSIPYENVVYTPF